MSREIKFRAWDPNDKKWMFDGGGFALAGEVVLMGEWGAAAWHRIADNDLLPLIPVQYTGLRDKNGVEIYEGDILLYVTPPEHDDGSPDTDTYVVEWKGFGFEATWQHQHKPSHVSDGRLSLIGCDEDMVIIGNIYKNPELVQAGDA